MSRTIITCALNGPTLHRGQCRSVPHTPQEIAAEAHRAFEAGCAIVHVHAREDGGGPSYRVERYREVLTAIRERCPAVLTSTSAGLIGVGPEDRAAALEARPAMVSLPMGSLTVARFNAKHRAFEFDQVFANRFEDTIALAERARALSVLAVASCYDLGNVASVRTLLAAAQLHGPLLHQLVLGVMGGAPATVHSLCRMAADMAPGPWQVVAANGAWNLRLGALAMGGHLRVGFQDGLLLPSGDVADSNGALVEAAVTLVRAAGGEPATPEEARELLGI